MTTLLQGVNAVLEKAQIVQSGNPLSTLTNSSKQIFIDNAIASWNEAIDQVYSKSKRMRPYQGSESNITLITGQRNYHLPSDLMQIRWPLHNETKGLYISQYPGGYEELRNIQTQPDNYTGQPHAAAISPEDGSLYLDYVPTSGENGDIYVFFYWKDTGMSHATDRFPFDDGVYRAMVPVVTELYRYNQNQAMNGGIFKGNYGRAVRLLKKQPDKTAWIKRYGSSIMTHPLGQDPFNGD